jgi:putative lipoic acid-binding regulatory protein
LTGNGTPPSGPHHPDAETEQRQEIELIEAVYDFPGDFSLSVIARNDDQVVAAILAAAITEAGAPLGHERQPSSGGKYVSHRLRVRVGSAHEAYAVRTRLRGVPGVMTVL